MPYRAPTYALVLVFAACGLAYGCGDDSSGSGGSDGGGGSVSTGGSGGETALGGTGGSGGDTTPPPVRRTISGDLTWQVGFDATAEAAGASDCSYTRHYEGVQDESTPWFCPQCEVTFKASVQMVQGLADCYPQVSPDPPFDTEWIGYGNGTWYRGVGIVMGDQGTADATASDVTVVNVVTDLDAPVGGLMGFDVAGTLSLGEEEGDPMHGWVAPDSYACGWPKADPPPYTGDYTLNIGDTVPDGLFEDVCQEKVRLHDFAGSYLLIDMSALDCPPCQSWASQEEQFVADMALQGIEVHVVTLMAPSLNDPLGITTTQMLQSWVQQYSLASPVLNDRGWGLSMFLVELGDATGYPSWVLADPNLDVLDIGVGFGGFDEIAATIVADAG